MSRDQEVGHVHTELTKEEGEENGRGGRGRKCNIIMHFTSFPFFLLLLLNLNHFFLLFVPLGMNEPEEKRRRKRKPFVYFLPFDLENKGKASDFPNRISSIFSKLKNVLFFFGRFYRVGFTWQKFLYYRTTQGRRRTIRSFWEDGASEEIKNSNGMYVRKNSRKGAFSHSIEKPHCSHTIPGCTHANADTCTYK